MMDSTQKAVYEIMLTVDEIAQKHNLTYSLAFGSVIGAIRHSGFIPWDSDMDIQVPACEFARFREVMSDNLPSTMRYINYETEPNYSLKEDRVAFVGESHEGIHLDIFPLIGAPGDKANQDEFAKKVRFAVKLFHCKYRRVSDAAPKNRIKMALVKPLLIPFSKRYIVEKYKSLDNAYDPRITGFVFVGGSGGYTMPYSFVEEVQRVKFEGVMLPIPVNYDSYLRLMYGDYMIEKQIDYYI